MRYPKTIPHGIMFHHFHGGEHPKGQGAISREDFDRILNCIGLDRFLSPSEWLEKLERQSLKAGDLCLTFDDGLLCQRDIALPVLEHYGLKAFWFVYSSVFEGELENLEIYRLFRTKYFKNLDDFYNLFFERVGTKSFSDINAVESVKRQFPFYTERDIQFRLLRDKVLGKSAYEEIMDRLLEEQNCEKRALAKHLWMSNDDLNFLFQKDHQIGLHSYSHPTVFSDLSATEQLEEYQGNYRHLKQVCGQDPVAMSHPCNSYNEETLGILRHLGMRCGFRSNLFPAVKGGSLNRNELEMAREDHANILLTMNHNA